MLTETALLYFFSASFQGLAAILGLLGVFAIFRLQQLGGNIDAARDLLFAERGRSTWPQEIEEFDQKSHDEKMKFVSAIDPKTYGNSKLPLYRQWLRAEQQIIKIRSSMWKPIALLTAAILLNIAALPFSNTITSLSLPIKMGAVLLDLVLRALSLLWNLWEVKVLVDGLLRE